MFLTILGHILKSAVFQLGSYLVMTLAKKIRNENKSVNQILIPKLCMILLESVKPKHGLNKPKRTETLMFPNNVELNTAGAWPCGNCCGQLDTFEPNSAENYLAQLYW